MSTASEKVQAIFRELAGPAARRLRPARFPVDVTARITAALADGAPSDERTRLRLEGIGFHALEWHSEAAFIVALCLYPDRFTDAEIRDGIDSLLLDAPAHIAEAARLAGYSTENIFLEPADRFTTS